jgi:molybdopterin molybdotransferase
MRSASSISQALAEIKQSLPVPRLESTPLGCAAGRILGIDVVADQDYWPFARAAMDGIAVKAADIALAMSSRPIRLALFGAIYCGDAPTKDGAPGTAFRIATGAPLPETCDAVIEQEVLAFGPGYVDVRRPVPAGNHVFPAGEDVRANELVIRAGTRLRGAQIGLLAVLGYADVPVFRAPRIALIACGDELVEPGTALEPGRIVDSNTHVLAAELRALGAKPIRLGIVGDDRAKLHQQFLCGLEADVIVTCGGLSVGERDFVRPVLREIGATFHFEGVPLKPGHPFSFATARGRPIFALPGTPGACVVAFEVFVRPAIAQLMGAQNGDRPHAFLRLEHDVTTRPGRARFLWARVNCDAYGSTVTPLRGQGTASIRSASDAHALIALPADRAFASAGTEVETWMLDGDAGAVAPRGVHAMVAVVGARNAGKTTLIERLIPLLARRGIRVGVIKHHGHLESLDVAGKDTARVAAAGAVTTILAGPKGSITRTACDIDPSPADLLAGMHGIDLVFLEGYADSALPKIRVLRDGHASDRLIDYALEIATVGQEISPATVPHFGWSALDELADHVLAHFGNLAGSRSPKAMLHAVS